MTGEVTTIGQARSVLRGIGSAAAQLAQQTGTRADTLAAMGLDPDTLGALAEIVDAAQALQRTADTAAAGLATRHAPIEEAIHTTPNVAAVDFYRHGCSGKAEAPAVQARVDSRPTDGADQRCAQVSFADLDRDARLEAMRGEIDSAVQRMAESKGWKAFLDNAAKFHRYSFGNSILAAQQRPNAAPPLAGYQTWRRDHDRSVRKGEKAIWIYAPITHTTHEVDPATGEEATIRSIVGFRPVPVYSLDQTEGKPLPEPPRTQGAPLEGAAPSGLLDHLTSQVTARGFTVDYRDAPGVSDGYTNFAERRVVIDTKASEQQRTLVLAHELAHIALGHDGYTGSDHTDPDGRRSEMEIEAESVAYILARHHGLHNPGQASFGYITGWAHGDTDKVRTTAEHVLAAARALIEGAEETAK